ncbi:MAG: thermonuclease family protein [Desulfovibrio sp.]|jgi:endonuclease YncB( thermonuclease family)|nr:thermonuclease family protein [Desulfovibrio sp.]
MKKIALLCILLLLPAAAFAHGGGLDSYGCHHNRKQGNYHCHRGPLAGQEFASQADMLAALNASGGGGGQEQHVTHKKSKKSAHEPPPPPHAPSTGPVLRVLDGDTITVRLSGKETRIRLYGVDAPEKAQPHGQEAKEFVDDLILTEAVTVEPVDTDRYGRTVAIIRLRDGSTLQDKLLAAGQVWYYPQYCKRPECSGWKHMESRAKSERRGLWRDGNPMPPWQWRKSHKN